MQTTFALMSNMVFESLGDSEECEQVVGGQPPGTSFGKAESIVGGATT
jgi:hypothetical protein